MGKLFVIEGLDGSGKETQSKMIYQRLIDEGYKVMEISYPRYEKDSSALVKMYLRGDFGKEPSNINPYISSTFYAADRYASYKTEYEEFYNLGGVVIADRYTTSNMVHQGGKIKDDNELEEYLKWLYELEFNIYQIPIPDKVFFLNLPLDKTMERIKQRNNKINNSTIKDIHENNKEHLLHSYNNALKMMNKYQWDNIDCMDNNRVRSIEEIHQELFDKITKLIKGD